MDFLLDERIGWTREEAGGCLPDWESRLDAIATKCVRAPSRRRRRSREKIKLRRTHDGTHATVFLLIDERRHSVVLLGGSRSRTDCGVVPRFGPRRNTHNRLPSFSSSTSPYSISIGEKEWIEGLHFCQMRFPPQCTCFVFFPSSRL